MKIKTNPLSVDKIKQISLNLRKKLNISLENAFPILNFLNDLVNKNIISIQVLENDNPIFDDNSVAKYNYSDNFIYIKEMVLDDIESNEYRSNFTLAHELFHFIQFNILKFQFEIVDDCKSYEDIEWQANEFAGQLLLPEEYLTLEDCELKEKYKVSLEAIATRKLYYIRRRNRRGVN